MSLANSSGKQNFVPIFVRTLVANGFLLRSAQRRAYGIIMQLVRYDEFGVKINYTISLMDPQYHKLTDGICSSLEKEASGYGGNLIVVGDLAPINRPFLVISQKEFMDLLGGPIIGWWPLSSNFPDEIEKLGHNILPPGYNGRPEDIFEEAVKQAFQFIFQHRVIRYGQERRFEALPDGIAFGHERLNFMYDCKAYRDGFGFQKDDIRRFGDYINEFHTRYRSHIGQIQAFLVVSGHFLDNEESLQKRRDELIAGTHVPLVCIDTKTLVLFTSDLSRSPATRTMIDWAKLFVGPMLEIAALREEFARIERDKIKKGG